MNKKILVFRFDFKRQKNLSFGHLFSVNKIISKLKKRKFEIYYLIKTQIKEKNYLDLNKKNLKQIGRNLFLKNKKFTKKIDFLFIDLPYEDNQIKFLNTQVNKTIIIEDHFNNYKIADYYFTNRKLNIKEHNKIPLNKNKIFHGHNYFINKEIYSIKKTRKKIKNIFINFGGSDPLNLTKKILNEIDNFYFKNYNFYIVLGPGAKKISGTQIKKNFIIFNNLSDQRLKRIRRNCDIAIISGGNILIENLFMGLPSIAYASSNYENKIINQLVEKKLVIKISSLKRLNLVNKIKQLNFENREKILKISKNIRSKNLFFKKLDTILNT